MISFLKRKREKEKTLPTPYFEFQQTLSNVDIFLSDAKTIADRIAILDAVLKMIKMDVQTDYLTDIIYKDEARNLSLFTHLNVKGGNGNMIYPHAYCDGKGMYSTHTKEKICGIADFRVALIFELSKMKYQLKEEASLKPQESTRQDILKQ